MTASMNLKKGDLVMVIAGKEKGKRGKILRAYPKEGRVSIEGLHLVKKHRKPKRGGQKGEVVFLSRAVNMSKVQILCSKCNKPTRIGFKLSPNGKLRVCRKCEGELV